MGLGDGDRVDEALMLARALDDLEAPHIRTLTALGHVARGGGKGPRWYYLRPIGIGNQDHLRDAYQLHELGRVAGGEHVAPAVLGVLTRHGLLAQAVRQRRDPVDRHVVQEQVWSITELGTSCLVLLRAPIPAHRVDDAWTMPWDE
jgi:hypothetical protein